jgi:hypothetical protein
MIKFISITFTFVFLFGCSPSQEKTTSTFTFKYESSNAVTPDGGVMVWGRGTTQDNRKILFAKNVLNQSVTYEIPSGNWHFYAVEWSGANIMQGAPKCADQIVNVSGSEQTIELSVSTANCDNSPNFAPAALYQAGVGFNNLQLITCPDSADVSGFGPTGTCDGTPGGIGSFRITLAEVDESSPINPNIPRTLSGLPKGLRSACMGTRTGSIFTALTENFPLGKDLQSPFVTVVEFFSDTSCAGTGLSGEEVFRNGLFASQILPAADYKLVPAATNTARAFVKGNFNINPPSSLALSAALPVDTITAPVIEVSGVQNTNQIEIFRDATCSNSVSAKVTVTADPQAVTLTALGADDNYTFFAKQFDPSGTIGSACSSASVAYTLDTTGPTMQSYSADKTGALGTGEVITFSAVFNEVVTASTTSITLNTPGADVVTVSGGSGTNTLTFQYTVGAGDDIANLFINVFNPGDIQDGLGNGGDTLIGSGSLGISLDTFAPEITAISATEANGSYKAGDKIEIRAMFSENLVDPSLVSLNLNTGGVATYKVGGMPPEYFYEYTIAAADTNVADLDVTAISSALAGDAAGNPVSLTLPTSNLAVNKDIVIDTTAPQFSSVLITEADGLSIRSGGTYTATDDLYFVISFTEDITVVGTPQLRHNASPLPINCSAHASITNALQCNYTVGPVDEAASFDFASTSALTLNGGSITDVAGNPANLNLTLGTLPVFVVTQPAKIDYVKASATTLDGVYKTSDLLILQVYFDKPVDVTNTADLKLPLWINSTRYDADYSMGSGGTTIEFHYTVQAGHNEAALLYANGSSLENIGIATVTNAGTAIPANLTLPNNGSGNSLGDRTNLVIDGVDLAIDEIRLATGPANLKVGDPYAVEVVFNEAVAVVGDPKLTLNHDEGVLATDLIVSNVSGNIVSYTGTVPPGAIDSNGVWVKEFVGTAGTDYFEDAVASQRNTKTKVDDINANIPAQVIPGFNIHGFIMGQANGVVSDAVETADGGVILVGNFTQYAGMPHNGIVKLLPNGDINSGFMAHSCTGNGFGGPQPVGNKIAPVEGEPGNYIIIGYFADYCGHPDTTHMVKINADGARITGFTSQGFTHPSGITGLKLLGIKSFVDAGSNPRTIIHGVFDSYNSFGIFSLIEIDSFNGQLIDPMDNTRLNFLTKNMGWNGFIPTTSNPGEIWSIEYDPAIGANGSLYIGGLFTSVADCPQTTDCDSLFRIDMNEPAFDTNFVVGFGGVTLGASTGLVSTIKLRAPNGPIVIGGQFDKYGNTTQGSFAVANPNSSLASTITPFLAGFTNMSGTTKGIVYDIRVQSNIAYIAGDFDEFGPPLTHKNIVTMDLDTGAVLNSNVFTNMGPTNATIDAAVYFIKDFPQHGLMFGGSFTRWRDYDGTIQPIGGVASDPINPQANNFVMGQP